MWLWPLSLLIAFVYLVVVLTAIVVGLKTGSVGQNRPSVASDLDSIFGAALPPPKPFSIIRVADAFDPEAAILWDTQLPTLELISSAGKDGIDLEDLRPMYRRSARAYPELYEGSSFEGWVQFLRDSELVEPVGSGLVITSVGSEFLRLPCNCDRKPC